MCGSQLDSCVADVIGFETATGILPTVSDNAGRLGDNRGVSLVHRYKEWIIWGSVSDRFYHAHELLSLEPNKSQYLQTTCNIEPFPH